METLTLSGFNKAELLPSRQYKNEILKILRNACEGG